MHFAKIILPFCVALAVASPRPQDNDNDNDNNDVAAQGPQAGASQYSFRYPLMVWLTLPSSCDTSCGAFPYSCCQW